LQDYDSQIGLRLTTRDRAAFDRIGTKLDLDPQVWIDLLKSLNDQRFSR
jgi:hypothetical protein